MITINSIIFILLAVLSLGLMILVHELGHFTMAKLSGVKVLEFTIGFGPAIWKKQKGDTLYALRVIPLGGAVMMEGEDEESDSETSFQKAKTLNKFLIVVAGGVMNLLFGLLLLFIWVAPFKTYTSTELHGLSPERIASEQNVFMPGDVITKVDGYRIMINSDISVALAVNPGSYHSFHIIRDGREMHLDNVLFEPGTHTVEGKTIEGYGLLFANKEAGFFDKIKLAFYTGISFIRLVFASLGMILTGKAGWNDLSGPVTITATISNVAQQSISGAIYLISMISVNLGIMNLLPLPALDGGRIVFIAAEALRGKPMNQKIEGYINFAGLMFFMILLAIISINDIIKLFSGAL